jgi:hypothetical protein
MTTNVNGHKWSIDPLQIRTKESKAIVLEHLVIEEIHQFDREDHLNYLAKITGQDRGFLSIGYDAILTQKDRTTPPPPPPQNRTTNRLPKNYKQAAPKKSGSEAITKFKDGVFSRDASKLGKHASNLYMLIVAQCLYKATTEIQMTKTYVVENTSITCYRDLKKAIDELEQTKLIRYKAGDKHTASQFALL